MKRRLLIPLCTVGVLVPASPAVAFWSAGGTGVGSASTATMPTGATPTTSVSGRSVTVSFAQNSFAGGNLSDIGGGYTVRRYANGSSVAVTPGAGCAGTITGAASTLSCTESGVPTGSWVYRVTPVLRTFTGTEGPPSNLATVVLAAPVLSSVAPANPAAGVADGPIAVTWAAAQDATAYNVYRRTPGANYDFASPLNGPTSLPGLTFSDTTATGGQTYEYVVRSVDATGNSASSNQLSARVISRPAAPATATASTGAAAITVNWAAVSGVAGYNVYRRTSTGAFDFTTPLNGATPVSTTTFKDSTALPGTTYVYGIRSEITGTGAAQVESLATTPTANASCSSGYRAAVQAQNPLVYYRLGETSGTSAANLGSTLLGGSYQGGVTLGQSDALICDTDTAVTLNGTTGYVASGSLLATAGPNTFSQTVWFKTTVGGGKLIGFGDQRTGPSANNDRHIYMTDGGRLIFGVFPNNGVKAVTSPLSYNDGQWHMATATLGPAGMRLYVDGAEVANDPGTTAGQLGYTGYFRVGYDTLAGWPSEPANKFFTGSLDEVSITTTQLSAGAVAAQYATGRP